MFVFLKGPKGNPGRDGKPGQDGRPVSKQCVLQWSWYLLLYASTDVFLKISQGRNGNPGAQGRPGPSGPKVSYSYV